MKWNTGGQKLGGDAKEDQVTFDEAALWSDFRSGNINAYATIYRKYFFVLFSYGKKLNADHELVKDCIQELFIKIWNNRENLSDTTAIKYYLFTALKRKLLDATRKTNLEVQMNDVDERTIIDIAEPTTQDEYDPKKQNVLKALHRLSEHQQKILDMKFKRNLSNKEIADELGIGIQSVYNAVFKALRSIRKHLTSLSMLALLLTFV